MHDHALSSLESANLVVKESLKALEKCRVGSADLQETILYSRNLINETLTLLQNLSASAALSAD